MYPSPPPGRAAVECRRRATTRAFPDPAALQTATRFSTLLRSRQSSLLACAIGEDPPLARPRPRELAIRLEEDRAHASLGQAPPADFCNTTRRAGTPLERSILVRELREAAASFSPLLAQKRRTHVSHRAFPLSRIGTTVKTSRTSGESFRLRSRYGPRAAERRTHLLTGELPSSNRSLEHPGRRILAPGGLETPPRCRDTA